MRLPFKSPIQYLTNSGKGGYENQTGTTSSTNTGTTTQTSSPWSEATPYWKSTFANQAGQQAPSVATNNYYQQYQNSLQNAQQNPYQANMSYLSPFNDASTQTGAISPYAQWAGNQMVEQANNARLNPFSGSMVAAGRAPSTMAALYNAQQAKDLNSQLSGLMAQMGLGAFQNQQNAASQMSGLQNNADLMNYQNQYMMPQQQYTNALNQSGLDTARNLQMAQLLQSAPGGTSTQNVSGSQTGTSSTPVYNPGWLEILGPAAMGAAGAAAGKK